VANAKVVKSGTCVTRGKIVCGGRAGFGGGEAKKYQRNEINGALTGTEA